MNRQLIAENMLYKFAISVTLFMAFLVPSTQASSGWFVPFAEYIGTSSSCSSSEVGVIVELSEYQSMSALVGPVASWRVNVRDSSGRIVRGVSVPNSVTSPVICFNPSTEGIQVVYQSDTLDNYRSIITPTMYPDSSITNLTGHQFRARLHLQAKSSASRPDIEIISPAQNFAFNTNPTFEFSVNNLPSLYGALETSATRLYLLNQTSGVRYAYNAPSLGGVGRRSINSLDLLPEGYYFWLFHQSYNGSVFLQPSSSILNWTFTQVPSTGASQISSFVVDRTPPRVARISSVNAMDLAWPDPNDAPLLVRIVAEAEDVLSGLALTTINIYDSLGTLELSVPIEQTVSPQSTIRPRNLVNFEVTASLFQGQDYSIELIAADDAGNEAVATRFNYTVPNIRAISLPVLDNMTVSRITTDSAEVAVTLSSMGGAGVTRIGSCWNSTFIDTLEAKEPIPDFSTDPSRCVETDLSDVDIKPGAFTFNHRGLPENSTIFHYTYASNMTGTSYTSASSFTTLPSAFAPDSAPVPPTLSSLEPTLVFANSASIGASITAIGGGLVTSRSICWSLTPPTSTTEPPTSIPEDLSYCLATMYTCPDGTVVGPNLNCEFICPEGSPATSAQGGEASGGETSSVTGGGFNPEGEVEGGTENNICTNAVFMCPDGTMVGPSASCEYVCPVTSAPESCQYWTGNLPSEAKLPFEFTHRFTNLPVNSLIYYRTFATNQFGTTYVDGQFMTDDINYDFSAMDFGLRGKPEITYTYDSQTETYDVVVPFFIVDYTNQYPLPDRNVRYRVEVIDSLTNTVIDQADGIYTAQKREQRNITRVVEFNNLPPALYLFRTTVNVEPTLMPEDTTPTDRTANNTELKILNLINPNDITGVISGTAAGAGPVLPDPGLAISLGTQTIRSGAETDLNWNITDPYPMECVIQGPPTFGTNGTFTFQADAQPVGSVTTGPLRNAQIFTLTCTEPITGTSFTEQIRINVFGTLREV